MRLIFYRGPTSPRQIIVYGLTAIYQAIFKNKIERIEVGPLNRIDINRLIRCAIDFL
jgi:hypothetical protein